MIAMRIRRCSSLRFMLPCGGEPKRLSSPQIHHEFKLRWCLYGLEQFCKNKIDDTVLPRLAADDLKDLDVEFV